MIDPTACRRAKTEGESSAEFLQLPPSGGRPLRQRKRDRESRAAAGLRLRDDAAVVRDDDLLNDGEAEAGTTRTRRDERAEDAGGDGGVDARTVVHDRDPRGALRPIDGPLDRNTRRDVG